MPDIFSTDTMNAVVASLLGQSNFLVDRYFPNSQTSTTEEIHFDVLLGKRRVAPFVSPLVEGQIVEHQGFQTNTFKPAYVKDKRVFDSNRPFFRSPGEPIGGNLSPMDRQRSLIARDMTDQLNMLNRRLEVMAGEVLATGKETIKGDKYPAVIVDFGRTAGQTNVIPAVLWSNAAALPLDDLDTWAMQVLQATGAMLTDVLMTVDVWRLFRANTQVKNELTLFRTLNQMPTLTPGTPLVEGGTYMGSINGYNIWVYSSWYVDPADSVEKPIIPAGTVILTSPALEGVRAYGAIRDEEAGLQALPYFVKSWIEPDPAVRFVMMQSAPLMVPYRPNASLSAKVV